MSSGFAVPLQEPVLPDERYLVVPRLGPDHAQARIHAEICDGAFRPPDAQQASSVESLLGLFVPFWRIDVDLVGMDDAARLAEQQRGYLGVPASQLLGREAKPAWMVCARAAFPFEMKHPSAIIPGDVTPIALHGSALTPGDPDPRYGWGVLDADIDAKMARSLAVVAVRKHSMDPSTLFTESEIIVFAIHFVRYPIWFARYRYRGQGAPTGEPFHVGISAVDGTPITALHPSKLAAGAAKIKKLFGFSG